MIIQYISNLTIPLLLFYVLGYGLFCKVDIFDAFVDGVKDGFRVVAGVLPTLIGLMIAIGILRASGILEGIASVAAPWTEKVFLPAALLPLSLIKMISSSAATGLLLDIYKEFGTDSTEGFMASLFMCCSETIFYTISVYFMATGDKDHKPVRNAVDIGRSTALHGCRDGSKYRTYSHFAVAILAEQNAGFALFG